MTPVETASSSVGVRLADSIYVLLAAALAVTAVGLPIWRAILHPYNEVDFRAFWFAGYMWKHGLDPYSSAYGVLGSRTLPVGNHVPYWFYPPNWWPFSCVLASFAFQSSLMIWRVSTIILMITSTGFLVARLTQGATLRRRVLTIAAACALATTMEATSDVLAGGQVSPVLVYCGLVFVVVGLLEANNWALISGLVLASLKPQIGIILFVAFVVSPKQRLPASLALALCVVFSLPQLIQFGVITTAREIISNLSNWNFSEANTPLAMTGFAHLASRVSVRFPVTLEFIICLTNGAISGLLLRRERNCDAVCLLVSGIASFVPLHNYDMSILVIMIILLFKFSKEQNTWCILFITTVMIMRPARLERMLSVPVYGNVSGGDISFSIAALLLFGLTVYAICAQPFRTTACLSAVGHRSPRPNLRTGDCLSTERKSD